MIRDIAKRALYHLSLQGGVVVCAFILFQVVPTDPARVALGPNASEVTVGHLRQELGLDKPYAVQFLVYLRRLASLDFGRSFVDGRLVGPEVIEKLTLSGLLVVTGLLLSAVWIVVTVMLFAVGQSRLADTLDFLCVSTPSMFSGLLVALLVSRFYRFMFFSGNFRSAEDWLALVFPAIALALYPMAILSRVVRAELRRIANAPYITTARSAGVPDTVLFGLFMGRNCVVPVLSTLAVQIPLLFTGAFVIEIIFTIPGAGSLLLKALLNRDLPTIQGIVLASSTVVVVSHLAVEFIQLWVDPRLRATTARGYS